MPAATVLAIDQGTTGSRALLVDAGGRVLARAYRELPQHLPEPGWVEHDPDEIWRTTLDCVREVLAAAPAAPTALGITNQRETVCVWDRRTGTPLAPAIVWQDRRTAARCAELAAGPSGGLIRERTGLVLDPYFSATKIEWLLRHVPDLRARVEGGDAVFGTVDAWVLFRLTGGARFATDHTNASRTMLYSLAARDWDDDLLGVFGVPRRALPEIRPSSGAFGVTDARAIGVEVPVLGVAGDQQASLFGLGAVRAGDAKNTYGTGAFLLLHTGATPVRSAAGLLTTVACGPRGEPAFALEGSVFIAGAAVQWLRDGLGIIARAEETAALAASVPDAGGVTFVPAFVGLGAPYWEPRARGTIVGLSRGTTRAHLARAALEAMAYGTKDVLDAMTGEARLTLHALRVDGGAAANDWLLQFQSDLLGVPVERPDVVETTALGAAGLAGLAAGVWRTHEDFFAGRSWRRFAPGRGFSVARAGWDGWRRAVAAALAWARAGGALSGQGV